MKQFLKVSVIVQDLKKFRKKAQLKKNSAVNQFFTGKSQMNI